MMGLYMEAAQIKKLAQLARIDIAESNIPQFQKDMEAVLGYVKAIESVDVDISDYQPRVQNSMREDTAPYESETYTKRIMDEAPDTENGYIKVQKIL